MKCRTCELSAGIGICQYCGMHYCKNCGDENQEACTYCLQEINDDEAYNDYLQNQSLED